jgi:hypothetical protein
LEKKKDNIKLDDDFWEEKVTKEENLSLRLNSLKRRLRETETTLMLKGHQVLMASFLYFIRSSGL